MADHRRESAAFACRADGPHETCASRRYEAPGAATGRRPTIALAFLERYPSPEDARGQGEKRLAAFLARNGYCGRKGAELLAEIGDRRDRHPTSSSPEAIAAQAPVAVESSKKKVACYRWACNKTLRTAVSVLADSSRKHNPWANDIYQRARARGHDHPHALRILGRAWLRVLWRLRQDGNRYDPARHGSLNRLIAAEG